MHSDNSLGKSLANVFAKTPRREAAAKTTGIDEVDLELIRPPGKNPRTHFDEAALDELTASIKLHGILQPIVVQKQEDGGYEVVAGERRYRAAKRAGLTKVPVVTRAQEDSQHLAELRLIENIQREDLNPIELATAYKAILDEFELNQEQLAERVGKERSSVANTLRLLNLDPSIRQEVIEDNLAMGHARALLSVDEPEKQRELARKIIEEGLTVRDAEAQVRLAGRATRGKAKAVPPHIQELEQNLFRLFGAPVKVREKNGKGSITVNFQSKAAFQSIVEVLDKACRDAGKT